MGNPQDLLNSKDGVYSPAEMYYAAVSYPCMRDAHGQCTLNGRFCQCACHQQLGISVPRPMEQVQAEVKAEIDAVLAERERCAKIAEYFDNEEIPGDLIARMIRNPEEWADWRRKQLESDISHIEKAIAARRKQIADEELWEARTGGKLPQLDHMRDQLRKHEEILAKLVARRDA